VLAFDSHALISRTFLARQRQSKIERFTEIILDFCDPEAAVTKIIYLFRRTEDRSGICKSIFSELVDTGSISSVLFISSSISLRGIQPSASLSNSLDLSFVRCFCLEKWQMPKSLLPDVGGCREADSTSERLA
jgi:hypothetical protein